MVQQAGIVVAARIKRSLKRASDALVRERGFEVTASQTFLFLISRMSLSECS
jgi:hypothetical protein